MSAIAITAFGSEDEDIVDRTKRELRSTLKAYLDANYDYSGNGVRYELKKLVRHALFDAFGAEDGASFFNGSAAAHALEEIGRLREELHEVTEERDRMYAMETVDAMREPPRPTEFDAATAEVAPLLRRALAAVDENAKLREERDAAQGRADESERRLARAYERADGARAETAACRSALRTLVDALPKCQQGICDLHATYECGNPYEPVYACSKHAVPTLWPLGWEAALNTALELLAKGESDQPTAARPAPQDDASLYGGLVAAAWRAETDPDVDVVVRCKCGRDGAATISAAVAKQVAEHQPLSEPIEVDGCAFCNPAQYNTVPRSRP